jgi:hypothetical protein
MASKAIQCKALRESLASCSAALKKQVTGRNLLKRKTPLGTLDLGRLARAVGLSCKDHKAVMAATALPVSSP